MMARLVDEITDLARLGSTAFVLRQDDTDIVELIKRTAEDLDQQFREPSDRFRTAGAFDSRIAY